MNHMIQFIDRSAAPEGLFKIGCQNPIFLQSLNHRLSLLSKRTEKYQYTQHFDDKVNNKINDQTSKINKIKSGIFQFGLKNCPLVPSSGQCSKFRKFTDSIGKF